MATGGGSPGGRKEEDFRHTCSLCMEPYRGRRPKLLPCFHTFCLPCLTALQLSVTAAAGTNHTDRGRLSVTAAAGTNHTDRGRLSVTAADDTNHTDCGRLSVTAAADTIHTDSGRPSCQEEQEEQSDSGKDDGNTKGAGNNSSSESTDAKTEDDVGSSQSDVDKPPVVTFPCPTCRTPVVIPKGGVACLQVSVCTSSPENGHLPTFLQL